MRLRILLTTASTASLRRSGPEISARHTGWRPKLRPGLSGSIATLCSIQPYPLADTNSRAGDVSGGRQHWICTRKASPCARKFDEHEYFEGAPSYPDLGRVGVYVGTIAWVE